MRALALLLSLAAPAAAAERAPVPRGAAPATLKAAVDRCKAAAPAEDRCFDLQLALARALLSSDPAAAEKTAEAARLELLDVVDALDDRIGQLRVKRDERTIGPGELAELARAEEQARRYWLDLADGSEVRGDAAAAAGMLYREVAARYLSAVSIRETHGRSEADARAKLRAAGKQAAAFTDSPAIAEALPIIRPAAAQAEAAYGAADPLAISLSLDLADTLAGLGQLVEAERLYRAARQRLAAAAAPLRLDADARLARLLARADRREEASALARDVLTQLIATRADEGRIARAYLDLATLLPAAEGLPLAHQGLALRLARLGPGHVDTARARVAVARLLETQDRFAEAETQWRGAIPVLRGTLFTQHPETAAAQLRFGENLLQQQKVQEAAGAFETAEYAFKESVGVAHPSYGRVLMFIAFTQVRQGNPAALEMMRQALAIIRAGLAPTHLDRAQAEFAYGMLLLMAGDSSGALVQFRAVGRAGLDRAAAYRDFSGAAQTEMRIFSGVYGKQVQAAWLAAQPK